MFLKSRPRCAPGPKRVRRVRSATSDVWVGCHRIRTSLVAKTRIFVPWRFLVAGRIGPSIAQSCRRPETCTGTDVTQECPLARGFATSLAVSMNSRATGLTVRFFSITTPFGTLFIGNSMGRILSSERSTGNRSAEAGKIVKKRPVPRRLILTSGESVMTVARGYPRPQAARACIAMDMIPLAGGESTHGASIISASVIFRLRAHALCEPTAITPVS